MFRRRLLRFSAAVLVGFAAMVPMLGRSSADDRWRQRHTGSAQTTPVRAALKRQADIVRRGVGGLPGMRGPTWRREFRATHPLQAPPPRLLPW